MPDGRTTCAACRNKPPTYTAVINLAVYEGVIRDCIHSLKYANNPGLGEFFSDWLDELVNDAGWSVDGVMPVPLGAQRLAERVITSRQHRETFGITVGRPLPSVRN